MSESKVCGKRGRPPDPVRRERRCEEILAAASLLFAGRGFAGTDLQEVADAVGVGKGTLYRHFPTKVDLFLAAVDREVVTLCETVDRAVEHVVDPVERISRGIHEYLRFFDERPWVVELFIQERAAFRDRRRPTFFVHQEQRVEPWRELIASMARDGVARPVSAERITDVVSSALYGTIFTNHFAGRRKSFEEQAQDLVDVILFGLLSRNEPVAKTVPRGSVRTPRKPRATPVKSHRTRRSPRSPGA
jgi:AcrR family transcriptional regulator